MMRGFACLIAVACTATPAFAEPIAAQIEGSSYNFDIQRTEGAIYNPWTRSHDRVELRSFVGSGAKGGDFVAPTLRIAAGDTLTINLRNRLEPCTAEQVAAHRCFNETNLHTHGLWVSPSGNSDNVLISIPPGESFRYQYQISADHPAGTFWYHPHRHGSGFVQVGSGMAGALIVTGDRKPTLTAPGDIDILLKDGKGKPLRERVMMLQQIQYGCLDEKGVIEGKMDGDAYVRPWTCSPGKLGRIESDDNDWDWRWSGRFTGINGEVQPTLEPAIVGRFERWRLVHAGLREPVRLRILRLADGAPDLRDVRGAEQEKWIADHCVGDALPMWHFASDGLTRSAVRKTQELVLFPGDRMDVLARFSAKGRYCLLQHVVPKGRRLNVSRVLAVVSASESSGKVTDGDAALQMLMERAAERALNRADQTGVRTKVLGELRDGLRLSSFVWHKAVPKEEVSGYREAIMSIIEPPDTNGEVFFHLNGKPYDHDRKTSHYRWARPRNGTSPRWWRSIRFTFM